VIRGEQWTLVADQGGLEILSATYVGQRLDRTNNRLELVDRGRLVSLCCWTGTVRLVFGK
jgi:hypothetical protein